MPPKKGKKGAAGYRLPAPMEAGTTLTDLAKRSWVLGPSVGSGGFGALYTAKEKVTTLTQTVTRFSSDSDWLVLKTFL